MVGEKSIRKNYVYNVIYQIITFIIPMVTTPYISYILGPEIIGRVSFAESITAYFVLFATMGITTFGQREVAICRDNIVERSRIFWEAKILESISSIVVILVYVPCCFFRDDIIVYLLFAFNILSVLVDITWFFQGLEEFGRIVFRNLVIKIFGVLYVFLFIKSKEDIYKYVFGLTFFTFAGNLSMWLYLPHFITRINFNLLTPFKHVKAVLSLFVPTIAIQVYTVLDKTMIGIITHDAVENGYYEQAVKMSKMCLRIITALGAVTIPRIAYYYNNKDIKNVMQLVYRSYRFVWFLGIPLCFGLMGISDNFVPWFYGEEFMAVIPILNVLSLLILAIGINNVTGVQYLISTKRQNVFTYTVMIGAIVNFTLNIVLIYNFKAIGAAFASISAETTIAIVQIIIMRKEISVMQVIKYVPKYLLAGLLMYIELRFLNTVFLDDIFNTIMMCLVGAMTYFALLFAMKDDFLLTNTISIMRVLKSCIKK